MSITSISSFDASGINAKLSKEQVTKKDIHEIKEYLTQLTDEIRYELQHVAQVEQSMPTKLSEFENDAGYVTYQTMPEQQGGGGGGSTDEVDPVFTASAAYGISNANIAAWNGKQDAISDLASIRSGAALGATALQSFTESDPTVPSWAKQQNKPSYTASEVGALPDTTVIPTVPSNVSAFNNDAGYINDISGKQDKLTAGSGISITGNVISATGGGGGGSYEFLPTLLWTNSNTRVAFAAQTISLDLSQYNYIGVEVYSAYNSDAQFCSAMFLIKKDGEARSAIVTHKSGTYTFARWFSASDTGVACSTGYRNGSGGTTYALPYKIYGIK